MWPTVNPTLRIRFRKNLSRFGSNQQSEPPEFTKILQGMVPIVIFSLKYSGCSLDQQNQEERSNFDQSSLWVQSAVQTLWILHFYLFNFFVLPDKTQNPMMLCCRVLFGAFGLIHPEPKELRSSSSGDNERCSVTKTRLGSGYFPFCLASASAWFGGSKCGTFRVG